MLIGEKTTSTTTITITRKKRKRTTTTTTTTTYGSTYIIIIHIGYNNGHRMNVGSSHPVNSVGRLNMRNIITRQDRDRMGRKLYDSLKSLDETPSNPIKCFDNLVLEDIDGEKVVLLLNDHVCRISKKGMIPKNWMKEGGWNQERPKALKPDYVIKLVEPLFAILQSCFPEHPKLQGDRKNRPRWWLETKSNLRKGIKKQNIWGENEEFDPKCAPIYIVNNPHLSRYKQGHMHYIEKADLYHMMEKLIKKDRASGKDWMSLQSQLLMSAFAVSRGGEVKWVRFSFWTYDTRFSVTDIGWVELKMSNFYGMPFFNYSNPDKFEVDNIHAFACACLSDSGILNRYGRDNRDFVWLDLQNLNDSSVCSRFRTEIRLLLPSDMPSAEVLRYMPKS